MQWFIDHLSQLSSGELYLCLAAILLLCGFGLPIPEDISLVAAGFFAHQGRLNVYKAIAVCFAAVLAGDTAAFFLGRWFGRRVLAQPWAIRYFNPRRQRRVRAYYRKFGSKVVVIGRFTPGLRFSIFFSAGMLHLRPSVFVAYDALAATVSVPLLVYLAYLFGNQIERVIKFVRHTEHGILIVVGGAAVFLLGRAYLKRRRRRRRLGGDGDGDGDGAAAGTGAGADADAPAP